ncbi:MAG: YdcF family protein [Thermoleophilia bacterium]|nr:YdcF family protein [Thermoleophilia bacterium]
MQARAEVVPAAGDPGGALTPGASAVAGAATGATLDLVREAPVPAECAVAGVPSLLALAVARGLALFIAGFTLLALVGELRTPGFDANVWWIDLRPLPESVGQALLAATALLLFAFAVRPGMGAVRRAATATAAFGLAAAALYDCARFYEAWAGGAIAPWAPVPLSLLVALVLAFVGVVVVRGGRVALEGRRRAWALVATALTVVLCGVLFPLAQVLFFGTTDYRRPADAAVVFGAQVHDDGRISTSLRDRVATAVSLYEEGLVERLVMSGGQGTAPVHEAVAMRDLAVELGVPAEAVVVDLGGLDTDATVHGTSAIFRREGLERVLAVSHFYHLARVKLAYQAAGWDVQTVPAAQTYVVPQTPRLVAREVPAFWLYYLRAVLR